LRCVWQCQACCSLPSLRLTSPSSLPRMTCPSLAAEPPHRTASSSPRDVTDYRRRSSGCMRKLHRSRPNWPRFASGQTIWAWFCILRIRLCQPLLLEATVASAIRGTNNRKGPALQHGHSSKTRARSSPRARWTSSWLCRPIERQPSWGSSRRTRAAPCASCRAGARRTRCRARWAASSRRVYRHNSFGGCKQPCGTFRIYFRKRSSDRRKTKYCKCEYGVSHA
jgi:hypothetical protein